ncbi:hypothetical protein [Pseudarthrobacter sp. PS3-L1]|uniref:hypothetical protein n=1 Tax=Pseudarthrobacter sp. PS3-L1 TaxID=3046207 RepID=UPI0024BB7DFF|nr:hypothetical protein [Pseudarthrobacter sp. PS3-L1]MDJ0322099.1 hypothetical protein [Pseudarthrobacter sp. PS3-L1]
MSITRTLEATAVKEGKWWTITIPELDQVSATKKITEVQEYAESLAAGILDVPNETIAVNVAYTMDPDTDAEWKAARADTVHAKELTIAAAARAKSVIEKLHTEGYSLREIESLVGVSFQRVSQILKS